MTDTHEPTHLIVGHVSKPHGIRGELYVRSLTDHPETTFRPGARFEVADPSGEARPDPRMPGLTVEELRPYREGFLVKFEGLADRTEAGFFRQRYLLLPMEDVAPLDESEVFYHQLLGMEVLTADGERLGEVAEVYELHPAHMLEVRGPEKMRLIPFRDGVVTDVDVEGRKIVVDPPEGLLDL